MESYNVGQSETPLNRKSRTSEPRCGEGQRYQGGVARPLSGRATIPVVTGVVRLTARVEFAHYDVEGLRHASHEGFPDPFRIPHAEAVPDFADRSFALLDNLPVVRDLIEINLGGDRLRH